MPSPFPEICASCGAEERKPVNLAVKLEELESWILLPHCGKCAGAGEDELKETARKAIEEKRRRKERREQEPQAAAADGSPLQ